MMNDLFDKMMRDLWAWWDGKKSLVGLVIISAFSIAELCGVTIPPELWAAASALTGVGVVHKHIKETKRAS